MDEPEKPSSWLERAASKDLKFEHGKIIIVAEPLDEEKTHRTRMYVALAVLGVLILVVVGWLLASVYLQHFQVGNQPAAAHQTNDALRQSIQKQAANYSLTIRYPDNTTKHFTLQSMGLSLDTDTTIHRLRQAQHQFAHQVLWWRPITAYLAVRQNSSQVDNFIANNATVTVQPAKDATLAIRNGTVVLTDSTAGKHYSLLDPVSTLSLTVSRLNTAPLSLQLLATNPAISSKQLEPYQEKLKTIINQSVAFLIGNKKVQASAADVAGWIELSPKNGGKSIDITVNSGNVLAYINKLAATSVHPPKAQVEIHNADGSITVLVPGENGTDVADKSTIATDVTQSLLKGSAISETLAVSSSNYKTIEAQAYDKWIEVDTTNKRMYAYEKTNLVKTFLVSAGAPKTPTVTGQYAIYAKHVQQDMRGRNADGSGYFQPHVPWVNYFYQDYAIHGNYWRPLSYFGNINSSHGCVGVTPDDGQWVYDWAPVGTPVIVHT